MNLLCPDCPLCGHPPLVVLAGSIQAFCGNDDCEALCWDPSKTRAENVRNVTTHDVSEET